MDILAVLIRVVHIASAIIAGGAAFFQLVAVRPALAALDESQRALVRNEMVQRWWKIVQVLIVLLLVTGLLNFLVYKVPLYRGQPRAGIYHGLFGLKLLAALFIFHGATVLSMPGPRFDKYRAKAGFWLRYLVALFAIVVILGAILSNFDRLFPLVAPASNR